MILNFIALAIGITFILCAAIAFLLWRKFRLRPQKYAPDKLDPSLYKFKTFDPMEPFNAKSPEFLKQSPIWREKMRAYGEIMKNRGVTNVIFVGGTFAGDDPFGISRLLMQRGSPLGNLGSRLLKKTVKTGVDTLMGDLGNFSPQYITTYSQAIGHEICVNNFIWSSANHHLARLLGALELCHFIDGLTQNKERILLIGHSHAGQLFSIFGQMMGSRSRLKNFLSIAFEAEYDTSQLENIVKKLSSCPIDVVTLGTSPRYPWNCTNNMQVIHIINHRGDEPYAGGLLGMPITRDGDYIQQLGIAGSDIVPTLKRDKILNLKLDKSLGVGFDFKLWREHLRARKRIHDHGLTYLVDYHDNSKYPNGYKTIFGHGSYTRYKMMLFNTSLMVEHFYS